jgi:hypothetical protein
MIANQFQEMEKRIEEYAGAEVREEVMQAYRDDAASPDPVKSALGYKAAIDRLDKATVTDRSKKS